MELPASVQTFEVKHSIFSVGADLDDADARPDAAPAIGVVTFRPSLPVQVVSGSGTHAHMLLKSVPAGYDETGTMRDGQGRTSVTLVSPGSSNLSRHDWAWVATFKFQGGLTLDPITFTGAPGSTVQLSDA